MLAGKTMVPGPGSAKSGSPLVTTIVGRSPVTSRQTDLASKPNGTALLGMASAESVPQQLDKTVGQHPLVSQFLKGACSLCPKSFE